MEKIAPLSLAERSWDNVGVLVECPPLSFYAPSAPPPAPTRVMLTIDLTDSVMQECLNSKINVLVAYHPPIFSALKRFSP